MFQGERPSNRPWRNCEPVTGNPSAAIIAKSGLTAVFKQQRRSQVANPFSLTALFCAPLLVCCGLVASPQVRAEDMRESDRTVAYVMLRDLQKEIERVYYDPNFKGVDIAANAALAKSRISKSSVIGEAWSAIAQFALDMDDSHTFFVPPSPTVQVDYGWDMG